jgi:hypothetical protein
MKLMNQWDNNVKFTQDSNIAYCVSIKTSSAWSSPLAGRCHSSTYKIPVLFLNSVESWKPIIVNCIKNDIFSVFIYICINTHVQILCWAISLSTLCCFSVHLNAQAHFWASLLSTLILSLFLYICTDPLFSRLALHIVSFLGHTYAQTLC